MTQNKYTVSERIVGAKYTFCENGVIIKTEQEENGYSRDIYTFPDESEYKGTLYKDEYDASGKLLKRSFLSNNGDRHDAYFEDGELKKVIKYPKNGKKSAAYINKTKNRVLTCFDKDGMMQERMVWDADNRLISEQKFYKNGVIREFVSSYSKNLPDYIDVFDENGEKLLTEFSPNEKGEIKRRIYDNEKPYNSVYSSSGNFLYHEYLLDDSKYHSIRVYRDSSEVERKTYLDENDVVREQSFYRNGTITRTEFLDTEGVVVGIVDYDEFGNIKTARRLDNEGLEYRNVELTAVDKTLEAILWEKNLLPYKEEDF